MRIRPRQSASRTSDQWSTSVSCTRSTMMLPCVPRTSTRHTAHDSGMRSAVLTPTRCATDFHHAPDSIQCPSTTWTRYVRSRHRSRCGTPFTAVTVSVPGGRFVIAHPTAHSPHRDAVAPAVHGVEGRRREASPDWPGRGVEARGSTPRLAAGGAPNSPDQGVPSVISLRKSGQPFEHLFEWL